MVITIYSQILLVIVINRYIKRKKSQDQELDHNFNHLILVIIYRANLLYKIKKLNLFFLLKMNNN